MKTEKQTINIPTRNNRLVMLYKSIKTPVVVLAGISSITLAVAILGFVMSKIGIENYYFTVGIIAGLLALGVAFFWEKTIAQTWTEFTRQMVNWEFEGRYQIALGVVIFIIPVCMSLGSVFGSIWGGYDIAEVTAGEANTKDVAAIASSLSSESMNIDANYSQQIKALQKEKAEAIATESALYDVLIKDNANKAWKAKQSGNDADYTWLNGGKRSTLLKAKQKAIAKIRTDYDALIENIMQQKNDALQTQNATQSAVLTSTMEENKAATETHRTKKERHEIGLTWLAAVSSPLYLLLILISSLIEANIGAISVNDLATDEERTKKKQHINTTSNANTNDSQKFAKFVQLVEDNNKSTNAPQQTQVTQTAHNPRVFDYTQTKSNLHTYLKRIKNDGYSDKRLDGVSRYTKALVAAGYKVSIDEHGKATVDEKNSPTLPVNSSCEIKYHDGNVVVVYGSENNFEETFDDSGRVGGANL